MSQPEESCEYPIDPLLLLEAPLPLFPEISLPPPQKQDLPPLPDSPFKVPLGLPELADDFSLPDHCFGLPSLPRPPLFQPRKIRRPSPERPIDPPVDDSLDTRVSSLSLDNAPSLPPPAPRRNPPRGRSPRISPTLAETRATTKRPRRSPTRQRSKSPLVSEGDESDAAYKPDADADADADADPPFEPDELPSPEQDKPYKPRGRKISPTKSHTSYTHRVAVRSLSEDHVACVAEFGKLKQPNTKLLRPHRFLCYIPGCARHTPTKDEMVRHFSIRKRKKGMHPNEEWDSSMVFKVPYGDWLGGMLHTFYNEW